MRRTSGDASTSSDETVRCSSAPRPESPGGEREERRRHVGHPRVDAERRGDAARELGRRDRLAVRGEPRAADGAGHLEQRGDGVREIAHVEEVAPVVDPAERQSCAARDGIEQRQEIALDARPVDERKPQHDRVERGSGRDGREAPLGVGLAARIRVLRDQRIVRPERPAGQRRLAVDLDRAREDESPHAGAHRRRGEALGRDDIGGLVERRRIGRMFRSARARDRRDARPPPRRRGWHRAPHRTPSRDLRSPQSERRGTCRPPANASRPRRTRGRSRRSARRARARRSRRRRSRRPGPRTCLSWPWREPQTNRQPCLP